MVFKAKDDIEPATHELNRLLNIPSLSKKQRDLIGDEIDNLRAGASGEKEAAYHIDFKLKDSKNYVVIHDLRIEHNGRVAQIDHLIIGRFLDVFVIESKNFSTSIRINNGGEFEVKTRYGWRGMSSPIEQNNRHIRVLDDLIKDTGMLPKRLGIQLAPTFHNWIVVAPECNVSGRGSQHEIMKMDMIGARMEKFRNQNSGILDMAKVISTETLGEITQTLVSHHRPSSIDYAAKFGISVLDSVSHHDDTKYQPPKLKVTPVESYKCCDACGEVLENKTVTYCRLNKPRFGGKLLCRKCQQTTGASCDLCRTPVDQKVVAYCRFNSRRFSKKVLCRDCQTTSPVGV